MNRKTLAEEIKEIVEKYRKMAEDWQKHEKTAPSYPVRQYGGQEDAE